VYENPATASASTIASPPLCRPPPPLPRRFVAAPPHLPPLHRRSAASTTLPRRSAACTTASPPPATAPPPRTPTMQICRPFLPPQIRRHNLKRGPHSEHHRQPIRGTEQLLIRAFPLSDCPNHYIRPRSFVLGAGHAKFSTDAPTITK
jgi:hypothetical protein